MHPNAAPIDSSKKTVKPTSGRKKSKKLKRWSSHSTIDTQEGKTNSDLDDTVAEEQPKNPKTRWRKMKSKMSAVTGFRRKNRTTNA
tara:strand:+ start:66 stop:323 length:258 start_codon:yes stop_codon:yes gene_type:complete